MSFLSLIAFLFGTAGVWLTIKKNIWCWPLSLVAVLASILEFFQQRLFGDMALQIVYLAAGIYGWYYWNKKKDVDFKIDRTKRKHIWILLFATLAQTLIYYFLLLKLKGDKPFLDALLTACSLTATYMMTKKWVENWLAWVIIDLAYLVLYGLKEMWLFGLLYLLFAVMAYVGWIKWKKELLKK